MEGLTAADIGAVTRGSTSNDCPNTKDTWCISTK